MLEITYLAGALLVLLAAYPLSERDLFKYDPWWEWLAIAVTWPMWLAIVVIAAPVELIIKIAKFIWSKP